MDGQFAESSSWHAIRPGYPALSLSVREITSVSVTFVLSSPYSAHDPDVSLASLGLSSSDDDDASTTRDSASIADTDQPQIVSGIIRNGFSVKVNGTPWRKVIVSKDDVDDEAIIIVHGLLPARQYDVELGVMPGESSLRGQVTTGASFVPSFRLVALLRLRIWGGGPLAAKCPSFVLRYREIRNLCRKACAYARRSAKVIG